MSIWPEFADQILAGSKRVEFRRRPPRANTEYVVIYATAPVGKVVGFFRVREIEEAQPSELWSQYGNIAGIDAERFSNYFDGVSSGCAIHVDYACALLEPVSLDLIARGITPPQGLRYLDPVLFSRLFSTSNVRPISRPKRFATPLPKPRR
jgi:predicted transcriptional regulator